jgi:hypothetical protein
VTPYLAFLFDGIDSLDVEDKIAVGIRSNEGESVRLITTVDISNYISNSESLLLYLEKSISEAVRIGIIKT